MSRTRPAMQEKKKWEWQGLISCMISQKVGRRCGTSVNRTDLVWCACVVRKGLTIHCGSWGLSCCLLSRAGGNRTCAPNFRTSSARVSQVTYQTVVGARYPELVTFNGTSWKFGKYVRHERPQRGGFLPIF